MAGNEEHPFASIVAAYHESQAPAHDTDGAAVETDPVETSASPAVEESLAEPVADSAPVQEPMATEPDATNDMIADEAEPTPMEPVEKDQEPVDEPAAEAPTTATTAEGVRDVEKPSALVDPFKSILAAYYAQDIDDVAAPQVDPEADPAPVAEQPLPPVVDEPSVADEPSVPVAQPVADIEPTAPVEEPVAPAEPATVEAEPVPVEEPPAEAVEEPAAHDEATPPAPAAGAWGRHAVPAEATGAAASVLAAYYADAPGTTDDVPVAATPEPELVADVQEPTEVVAAEVEAEDMSPTAVLPTIATPSVLDAPSNPLGNRAASGGWGAQALAAAGSTTPIEPNSETLPAAVQHRATEFIDTSAEEEKDKERSEARRKFLMLAPIGAIAALAVLAVLLWNGHKSTPTATPTQTSSPPIILDGSPLKRTQDAYTSVLNRFTNANDAGGAVVAGGAAHDTLRLLKDFKGATAQDKALLAAERAHLGSLSGLATASPSSFGGAAGHAKNTLTAVQKAAAADAKAKAPNSSAATGQAIDLLGEGNVTKLQVALNSLISRSDSASVTSQLRGVASEAAGNADSANSLASVIKNPSVQTTASSLANKFSSMAPMARLSGDTLSDWSNIRPGMVSAMGLDPVTHIDSLIANAKQKIAAWQANQGNNASTQAINAYAGAMRSHFGSFGGALSQIPSLNSGETCAAGAKDGTRSRAGNALVAVNNAANGFRGINAPASLAAAHNALVNAINVGSAAAAAAQNVTVLCGSGTYGASGDWGTYSNNIWIKGGWGGKVGAWEAAVSAALQQASTSGTKPIV